jgi:hypothetical protein
MDGLATTGDMTGDMLHIFTVAAVFDDNNQGYVISVQAPSAEAAVAMVEAPTQEGYTSCAVAVFPGDVPVVWTRDAS